METLKSENVARMSIFHQHFNLDKKHNLSEVPEVKAVFGVFAIVEDEPINCRYIGITDNLRESIKQLFESPGSPGLKKFMQGPWYKTLLYEELQDNSGDSKEILLEEWISRYAPKIDDDGEYPGYYDY